MSANNKDRGLLKWQGFFMPEHSALIAEMRAQLDYEPFPGVDEFGKAENEAKLTWAYRQALELRIKWWADGKTKWTAGRIAAIDVAAAVVYLETVRIGFDAILHVELDD